MNKVTISTVAAVAILISSSVWATSDGKHQESSDMPMTQEGDSGMMMNPQMMQHMQMMHQKMMHKMNGMDHGHGHGYGHGMPMMGGGMGNMMMNPQMMQMRKQHMTNMEQRLQNIEALLTELVEQGK